MGRRWVSQKRGKVVAGLRYKGRIIVCNIREEGLEHVDLQKRMAVRYAEIKPTRTRSMSDPGSSERPWSASISSAIYEQLKEKFFN